MTKTIAPNKLKCPTYCTSKKNIADATEADIRLKPVGLPTSQAFIIIYKAYKTFKIQRFGLIRYSFLANIWADHDMYNRMENLIFIIFGVGEIFKIKYNNQKKIN
ncbi:hypothetical protein D3C87_1265000 [compost metagenome]